MVFFKTWSKFFAMLGLILSFLAHHFLLFLFVKDTKKRDQSLLKNLEKYAKIAQKILNINLIHADLEKKPQGVLIVSNHLSYVDVLILAGRYPSLFITSVEIKETFLLGQVTKLAGCFFVERRKSKITSFTKENEMSLMKEKLAEGFNILLFPEGTSSDGQSVLPFKATFFQLATDCNIPILPVTLKYKGKAKDIVPWYGAMTFPDHLKRVCSLKSIDAHLTPLEMITGDNKFQLATESHARIRQTYCS